MIEIEQNENKSKYLWYSYRRRLSYEATVKIIA